VNSKMKRTLTRLMKDSITRENWKNHPNFIKSRASAFLDVHHYFLNSFQEMEKFLKEKDLNQATTHFETLIQNLHGHHHVEETKIFPSMENQSPQSFQQLYGDHVEMNAMLEDIKELLKKENNLEVIKKWETFKVHMCNHFKREEDIVVPLMISPY
jgi:DUF438 domain-containing protein